MLALILGVLLHVAVLAEAFGVFGLVRAADGTLFSTLFEVTVNAHSFGIVLLVSVGALCDGILLADDRLFAFGASGAAACPLLADQFFGEVHRLYGMLQVFGS